MLIRQLRKEEALPYDLLLMADPNREMIENYIEDSCVFAAFEKESLIGVCVLYTEADEAEIKNLAVKSDYQGKGIAKQLIHAAIRYSKSRHHLKLMVCTGNSSIGQLALYQKSGFRMTAIDFDFFIRHYPEKIVENGIPCRDLIRLEMQL